MYEFIINPSSGSGRGGRIWEMLRRELERRRVPYRACVLKGPGEARARAEKLAKSGEACTLVVVGGDGTVNETVSGLSSFANITFACIPTGSGNDFVRGLHLEREPLAALSKILEPKKIGQIDIGTALCTDGGWEEAKSFSYAVSAGMGFDAAVCNSVLHSRVKKVLNRFHSGKVIYLLTAVWLLLTMKRRPMEICIDGQRTMTFQKVYFAAAMNLGYEGGGFWFAPKSRPDDGYLELICAGGISRLRVFGLLPLALKGKHEGKKGVYLLRCRTAEVSCGEPLCVHTDGEIPGFYKKVRFGLRKEKLRVILG